MRTASLRHADNRFHFTSQEIHMKRLFVLAAVSTFAFSLAPAAMAGPQQERMKACSAEAKTKGLKGDERKAFMKDCLSAKKTAEAKTKG
jgi:hypothetical protein